ncbi:unnamed protein product, partial [Brassica rapa subsp. trilocularis]
VGRSLHPSSRIRAQDNEEDCCAYNGKEIVGSSSRTLGFVVSGNMIKSLHARLWVTTTRFFGDESIPKWYDQILQ